MKKMSIAAILAVNTVFFLSCSAKISVENKKLDVFSQTIQSNESVVDILNRTASAYEARPDAYIADILKIAPDRNNFAVFDGGSTRIYGRDTGKLIYIRNSRPIVWKDDSSHLYILSKDGDFFTVDLDGKITAIEWLGNLFGRKELATNFSSNGLIASGFGLIAMPDPSRRTVTVANVSERAHYRVIVGVKWLSSRPVSRLEIGWNAQKSSPAVFVAEQVLSGQSSNHFEITNRLEVYGPRGEKDYFGGVQGGEVRFLPVLTKDGAKFLARTGNFRCLHTLADTGASVEAKECNTDIETVTLDRDGEVLTYSPFVLARSVAGARYSRALGPYNSVAPVGIGNFGGSIFWLKDMDGDRLVEISDNDRTSARVLVAGQGSELQNATGQAISGRSSDGLLAQGFLLKPASKLKLAGLVVVLHGGPYAASNDGFTTPLTDKFLNRGFAVLSVNYRGGPGYGRSFLEKGFDGGILKMLDDVDAMRIQALSVLGAEKRLPVFLYGRSFGGLLAAKSMKDQPGTYSGYLIEGGICDFNISERNVMLPGTGKASLAEVIDPSIGVYNLRIAARGGNRPPDLNFCKVPVPSGARLVILHSKDDTMAPYASMSAFAQAQPADRTTLVTFQNEGHAPLASLRAENIGQFDAVATRVIDLLVDGVKASEVGSAEQGQTSASH